MKVLEQKLQAAEVRGIRAGGQKLGGTAWQYRPLVEAPLVTGCGLVQPRARICCLPPAALLLGCRVRRCSYPFHAVQVRCQPCCLV